MLSQLNYNPKELLCNGDIYRMFEEDYPNFYFHHKPNYFDFFYTMNLCYYLVDLVWLIWISETSTDFNLMMIHLLSTSVLIFFLLGQILRTLALLSSFYIIGNVFGYFIRVFLYSQLSPKTIAVMTFFMICIWIYTRLFVFGKLILVFT